jgi:hypothetical protein
MIKVNNLEEARDFFLSNSAGNVICLKNGKEIACSCYADAEEIFTTNFIKVSKITPTIVEHFNPEGESLGFLNELESNDLRIQIAELKVEGYYVVFNEKRIEINTLGEMSDWPRGMYDLTMVQFSKLFQARGYAPKKTNRMLYDEFNDLDSDVKRWNFIARHTKDRGIVVRCDNDDTYAIMPGDEGEEDDYLLQIQQYVGNSYGIYDLLESKGIKAEGV